MHLTLRSKTKFSNNEAKISPRGPNRVTLFKPFNLSQTFITDFHASKYEILRKDFVIKRSRDCQIPCTVLQASSSDMHW